MLHLIVAIVAIAAHHPTLVDRLLDLGKLAAALGAIGALGVFLWTRLRLDRGWRWLFRHIQEDQKVTRMAEFLEAQSDPNVSAVRRHEFEEAINLNILPKLAALTDGQGVISKRTDDHMDREEEAAAENNQHVSEIRGELGRIADEQRRVAEGLALELQRVAADRPIWLADREQVDHDRQELQAYMAKGRTFIDEQTTIVAEHIAEDAKFQQRVEPFLTEAKSDGETTV